MHQFKSESLDDIAKRQNGIFVVYFRTVDYYRVFGYLGRWIFICTPNKTQ